MDLELRSFGFGAYLGFGICYLARIQCILSK